MQDWLQLLVSSQLQAIWWNYPIQISHISQLHLLHIFSPLALDLPAHNVHQTTVTSQLGATGHPLGLGERCLRECKISPSDSYFADGYVIAYKVGYHSRIQSNINDIHQTNSNRKHQEPY